MNTYSQIGQDLFTLLCHPNPGVFLDIGCNSPSFQSNSRLLLERGWGGTGIDLGDYSAEWRAFPKMEFIQSDILQAFFEVWDEPVHLSIDVDEYSFVALFRVMDAGCRPGSITIEHDAYRFGDCLRGPQRRFLEDLGYVRVASDLHRFEDWWADPFSLDADGLAAKLKPIDGRNDPRKIKNHLLDLVLNVNMEAPNA
jgi:hypothetical protein